MDFAVGHGSVVHKLVAAIVVLVLNVTCIALEPAEARTHTRAPGFAPTVCLQLQRSLSSRTWTRASECALMTLRGSQRRALKRWALSRAVLAAPWRHAPVQQDAHHQLLGTLALLIGGGKDAIQERVTAERHRQNQELVRMHTASLMCCKWLVRRTHQSCWHMLGINIGQ